MKPFLALAAVVALLAVACGEDAPDAPAPNPTAPPPEAATPTEATTTPPAGGSPTAPPERSLDHDIERAITHVQVLSVAIGPRVSGTRESRETVAYISGAFRDSGYAVEVMEFNYETRFRPATVTVGGETIAGVSLNGTVSPPQSARGPAYGEGSPEGASIADSIVVDARSANRPDDGGMYASAALRRAAGVVIVNHEQWPLYGFPIPSRSAIPVVLVQAAEAERFERAVANGALIEVTVGPARPTAANVIARPFEGARCDILVGGHHDTVAGSPGAIDNASGVAIVLELARLFAADGLDEGLCFATFGAEESGLFGSVALAQRWAESGELPEVMVNFDVTARGHGVELIGSSQLIEQALDLLEPRGIPAYRSSLPPNTGSDHQSFLNAGVPVLFFSDGDISLIHTPADVFAEVEPAAVDRIGDAAAIVLAELVAEIAGGP